MENFTAADVDGILGTVKDAKGRRCAKVPDLIFIQSVPSRKATTIGAEFLLADGRVVEISTEGVASEVVTTQWKRDWTALVAMELNAKVPGSGRWYRDGKTNRGLLRLCAPLGTF